MKKLWLSFTFSSLLCLLAVSGWLLLNPTPVSAAGGSAKCAGGTVVRCEATATACNCTDYSGCTSTMPDGTSKETKCDSEELLIY